MVPTVTRAALAEMARVELETMLVVLVALAVLVVQGV
jgi:hypothetical protein